ncbi:MAG: M90 family metallopeptidase [Caldimonas sp.]
MSTSAIGAGLVLAALLIGFCLMLAGPWWVERRRDRIRQRPFPRAWRRILRKRVPLLSRLPADLQIRLRRHILVFLAEKPFIGCQGQPITDEVRLTIAAKACLLLLGRSTSDYYPRLNEILVYPDAFVVTRERPVGAGVVQEQRQATAGESWARGQVILSWAHVVSDATDSASGRNVAVHEFAHQIDQDSGVADGCPWRPTATMRTRWNRVMDDAFQRLQTTPSSVIDSYAATDRAEFFAVVSEVFFERPLDLAREEPAVYRELAELYGVHPLVW